MKSVLLAALIVVSLTLAAVAGVQERQAQSSHRMNGMMTRECPMKAAADVDLSIEDTNDGIRLSFTTKSGDVAELRRRVEAMARMHGTSEIEGMHRNMMPFSAVYEAIPDGARLTLTSKDPLKLEEFRQKVREHAAQMKKGECAMMESMMHGMMDGKK
jgi:hypothetical protein